MEIPRRKALLGMTVDSLRKALLGMTVDSLQKALFEIWTMRMTKEYYIYLLTNKHSNVLYVGITNDLVRRVYEHKNKFQKGFTEKYNVDRLVYYEIHTDVAEAILREKQIKGWSRKKKNELVNQLNVEWKDLYEEIC